MPVTKKFIQGVTQITAANLNKTGFYNLVAREQDTQDMTLAISSGVVMINGTIVKYAGGNTGSFTAPSTNPRIDLVTLDTTGTIGIIQGVEAASPVAPAYPIDKLVICEVYLRTSSTKIYQEDQTTHAYIKTESRHLSVENYRMRRFFGTGADGDVSITSGTTTLAADMNYNSLKISSGANLKTNGYRVFVLNELYNAGTIYSDGGAGGNATRGAVATKSVAGTAGTATSAGTLSAGTAGVVGGDGDYTANNGACGAGGGSGASGGVILLLARVLTNIGTIRANGGVGGNGADGWFSVGGGAGTTGGSVGNNGTNKTALGSNGVVGGAGGKGTVGGGYSGGTAGTCTGETVSAAASLLSSENLTAGGSNTYSDILSYSITASTNTTSLSCSAGSGSGGGGRDSASPNYIQGGGGGGGGGSGGVIILGYQSITLGTVQVNGGNGGNYGLGVTGGNVLAPNGNGVAGTNGIAGKIYKLIVT